MEFKRFVVAPKQIGEALDYLKAENYDADTMQTVGGILCNFGRGGHFYTDKGLSGPGDREAADGGGVDSIVSDIRGIKEVVGLNQQIGQEVVEMTQTLQERKEKVSEQAWRILDRWYLENERLLEKLKAQEGELPKTFRDSVLENIKTISDIKRELDQRYRGNRGVTESRVNVEAKEAFLCRRRQILFQESEGRYNRPTIEMMAEKDWIERQREGQKSLKPILTEYERSGLPYRNNPRKT